MNDVYERAEQFLPENSNTLVSKDDVSVSWIGEDNRFWYRDGDSFAIVDATTTEQYPAFDHQQVADSLSKVTERDIGGESLPFETFEFVNCESAIRFDVDGTQYECDLSTYTCRTVHEDPAEPIAVSPDGRWEAFVKDYDLYVRDSTSDEIIQLTEDGTEQYGYAMPTVSPKEAVNGDREVREPDISWSPDSQRLITYRLDERSAAELALVQSSPEDQLRPKYFTYSYPLPGDVGLPVAEPVVFDVERRQRVAFDIDPIPSLYYDHGPLFDWYNDSERLHYVRRSRGRDSASILEIDAESGRSRTVYKETSETLVDPHTSGAHLVDGGEEIIWTSERSGWHHLYLLDGTTGELKQQLTSGEWVVRELLHIDEENRRAYFTASGRDETQDPYLKKLYRVDLDGSNLTPLTPDSLEHSIDISPSGEYFVDTRSSINTPPVSVLRDTETGEEQFTVAEANAEELRETGWTPPESFEATAADGETSIYGILWRPSTFDPSEEYPVVEQIYTGPHDFHVPKDFNAYCSSAQAIAELGFIVVMVDGRGTGRRSKAFRDASYKNLSRGGLEDHKATIEQLSETREYIDDSAVGIYGHSAGGYDSAHALLQYPEFYDVAVSSGGNHDHRLDKASWNELWMGYPVEEHYEEQSNISLADQLDGDLLLMHGELDQNVPPSSTLQFVDALMDAHKTFDMYLLPNSHHDLSGEPFFHRARWDHFVENLRGETPPEGYKINSYLD